MVTRLGAELREHDIVNVVGLPGVGKLTVVSAYASSAEEGQDEPRLTTAWLGLSDDTRLEDIVGTVLDVTGAPAADLSGASAGALARLLVGRLRATPLLLVLDQADVLLAGARGRGSGWATVLLDALAQGTRPSRVIVVSTAPVRTRGGLNLAPFHVKGLGLKHAVALLRQAGAAGTPQALHAAAARTAGHPLALLLLAQAAQGEGSLDAMLGMAHLWQGHGEDIARRVLEPVLAGSLTGEQRRLLEAFAVLHHPAPAVLAAVAAGFPVERLGEAERLSSELLGRSSWNAPAPSTGRTRW